MSHYKYRCFLKVKMPTLDIKQIIGIGIISLLILGIGAGVYLVQRQQTLKGRAVTPPGNFVTAFEIREGTAGGRLVSCDPSAVIPTCTTRTLDINVRVATTEPLLP